MRNAGLLQRVARGRYVLSQPGTTSIAQNAPAELVVDLLLRNRDYYLGWLTALIDHRLTDLHTRELVVGVPYGTRLRGVLPLDLKLVQMSPRKWPNEQDLTRSRVSQGKKEFVWRSTIERTLVDSIDRPELSGGFETVAVAWARALQREEVSWQRVAAAAKRLSDSTTRRTAFILCELGLDAVAEEYLLAGLDARRSTSLLDRTGSFTLPATEQKRDARTGIAVNVPRSYLRGWLGGEVG